MDDPRPVEFSEFEDLLDREKFTGAVLYLWVFQILRKVEKNLTSNVGITKFDPCRCKCGYCCNTPYRISKNQDLNNL